MKVTSDRNIRKAFGQLGKALRERYGAASDCTGAQLERTVDHLGISEEFLPYAAAVFEHAESFQVRKAQHPEADWKKVDEVVARVLSSIRASTSAGAHFYESNIGYPTD